MSLTRPLPAPPPTSRSLSLFFRLRQAAAATPASSVPYCPCLPGPRVMDQGCSLLVPESRRFFLVRVSWLPRRKLFNPEAPGMKTVPHNILKFSPLLYFLPKYPESWFILRMREISDSSGFPLAFKNFLPFSRWPLASITEDLSISGYFAGDSRSVRFYTLEKL